MEPIEINAGAWYLRALRADERVDDRPTILAAAQDADAQRFTGLRRAVGDLEAATAYVDRRTAEWVAGTRCSWAVCEPSSGQMLGEVTVMNLRLERGTGEVGCWTAPEHRGRGIMTTAVGAALRLAFAPGELGGLGLHRVEWRHDPANTASAALAARCGFTREGVAREAGYDHADLVVLARLATD